MLDRRNFMKTCSGMGLAGTLFPGVLWAQAQAQGATKITKEMIENAASIADVAIADDYKQMMLDNLNEHAKGYEEIYKLHIPNSVDPALIFSPVTSSTKFETEKWPMKMSAASKSWPSQSPNNLEELAFASVRQLAELVRTKKVSSLALTKIYLERLQRYDQSLKFVVTLTEERALEQAKKADAEIAAGKYRGPLHGLPWGAKDLLDTAGIATTYCAEPFRKRVPPAGATGGLGVYAAGAGLGSQMSMGGPAPYHIS